MAAERVEEARDLQNEIKQARYALRRIVSWLRDFEDVLPTHLSFKERVDIVEEVRDSYLPDICDALEGAIEDLKEEEKSAVEEINEPHRRE